MPLILALGKQRQVDLCKVKTSLVYTESSRTSEATQRNPISKTQPNKQNKNPERSGGSASSSSNTLVARVSLFSLSNAVPEIQLAKAKLLHEVLQIILILHPKIRSREYLFLTFIFYLTVYKRFCESIFHMDGVIILAKPTFLALPDPRTTHVRTSPQAKIT